MAARIGEEPSVLLEHPIKTQLLAMGLGGVGAAYTADQDMPTRLAATLGPLALVQLLRRHELKKIQGAYDTENRKRLSELDQEELFDGGFMGMGGASRLGATQAYETMRKRKYENLGAMSEGADAMQLAANGLGAGVPAAGILGMMDNRAAEKMLKRADFSEQRNSPTIPLAIAAGLMSSLGLEGSRRWAQHEARNSPELGTDKWKGMINEISGSDPLLFSTEGTGNAGYFKPRSEMEAVGFLNHARGWKGVSSSDKPFYASPYQKRMGEVKQLLAHGAIVADSDAGAPTIAHEAGHSKIENTPGIIRALQRHVYPHQKVIAPLAGAGSMAAGLAAGGPIRGALLGTLIGGVAGAGQVGPEAGASHHALKHLKGLGDGSLTAQGKKDLLSALSTYLAFNVLPSTLSGAAGGYIAGRRKKKEAEAAESAVDFPEEQEKAAAWDIHKSWRALRHIREHNLSGHLADEYIKGLFGVHYKPFKSGFYKTPEALALGIRPRTPVKTVEMGLKSLRADPAPPPTTGAIDYAQDAFDFFKQGAHPALPGLIRAKSESDRRRYPSKHKLIRMEMRKDPGSFVIDSDDGKGIVGITHVPTGFRIHMLRNQVGPGVISMDKVASLLGKTKGIAGQLVGPKPLFRQTPLFGKRLANLARDKGVVVHHPGVTRAPQAAGDAVRLGVGANPILQKVYDILRGPRVAEQGHAYAWQRLKAKDGVHVDFTGRGRQGRARNAEFAGRARSGKTIEGVANSKLREAQYFPELLPRTERLSDAMGAAGVTAKDPAGVLQALRDSYGARGFVLKPDGGFATSGSSLLTDKSSASELSRMLRKGIRNNQNTKFSGDPRNMVVQEKLDLAPLNRVERGANNLFEAHSQHRLGDLRGLFSRDATKRTAAKDMVGALAGGKLPFAATGSSAGGTAKEFRVHVIDGKVVPYATSGRGSVLGALPFRTRNHGLAEKSLQEQLRTIDPKKLKGTWGMDVMKTRDGKFRVVETNPTTAGGSGFASAPHIQDAFSAAIEGRLPRYVATQRAASAAGRGGALAGMGLAARAANADSGDQRPGVI